MCCCCPGLSGAEKRHLEEKREKLLVDDLEFAVDQRNCLSLTSLNLRTEWMNNARSKATSIPCAVAHSCALRRGQALSGCSRNSGVVHLLLLKSLNFGWALEWLAGVHAILRHHAGMISAGAVAIVGSWCSTSWTITHAGHHAPRTGAPRVARTISSAIVAAAAIPSVAGHRIRGILVHVEVTLSLGKC